MRAPRAKPAKLAPANVLNREVSNLVGGCEDEDELHKQREHNEYNRIMSHIITSCVIYTPWSL
jgi:hypothetical protein